MALVDSGIIPKTELINLRAAGGNRLWTALGNPVGSFSPVPLEGSRREVYCILESVQALLLVLLANELLKKLLSELVEGL